MARLALSLLLQLLLLANVARAKDRTAPPALPPSSVQAQLARAPVNARLEVILADGRKLRGRLGSVAGDASSFVLRVPRKGAGETNESVPVSSVNSLRRLGNTAAKVGIGIALGAAGVFAVLLWISYHI